MTAYLVCLSVHTAKTTVWPITITVHAESEEEARKKALDLTTKQTKLKYTVDACNATKEK